MRGYYNEDATITNLHLPFLFKEQQLMQEDETSIDESTITPEVLEANKRWIELMHAQSEIHRKSRDPSLFRQAAKQKLISPPNAETRPD